MKIILTGATGFVGSEVLTRLLRSPSVTEVMVLTRKPVDIQSPKLETVLMSDFARYDAALSERVSCKDACIWALGGKASDLGTPGVYEEITHTFTLALANAVASSAKRPFTFCYLSGMGADPSESARLPWQRLTRHLKGRTEKDLRALQSAFPWFWTHSFRPGGILPLGTSAFVQAALAPIVVGVGDLADAMIAACDQRLFGKMPIVCNAEIKRFAGKAKMGMSGDGV